MMREFCEQAWRGYSVSAASTIKKQASWATHGSSPADGTGRRSDNACHEQANSNDDPGVEVVHRASKSVIIDKAQTENTEGLQPAPDQGDDDTEDEQHEFSELHGWRGKFSF
jgi:hypothetical protein